MIPEGRLLSSQPTPSMSDTSGDRSGNWKCVVELELALSIASISPSDHAITSPLAPRSPMLEARSNTSVMWSRSASCVEVSATAKRCAGAGDWTEENEEDDEQDELVLDGDTADAAMSSAMEGFTSTTMSSYRETLALSGEPGSSADGEQGTFAGGVSCPVASGTCLLRLMLFLNLSSMVSFSLRRGWPPFTGVVAVTCTRPEDFWDLW